MILTTVMVVLSPWLVPILPGGQTTHAKISPAQHTHSETWKKWHPITLTFTGPFAHELDTDPTPFWNSGMDPTGSKEAVIHQRTFWRIRALTIPTPILIGRSFFTTSISTFVTGRTVTRIGAMGKAKA